MIEMKSIASCLAFLSSVVLVASAPNPSTPDTGVIGSQQTFTWAADSTGKWTSCDIVLKTGDNLDMVNVTSVVTGLDCTTTTSYTWTVPAVNPTSTIYFFEFDGPADTTDGPVWTTRWAIVANVGATPTKPTNSKQPDGEAIPWGTGKLVNGAVTGLTTASSSSSESSTAIDSLSTSSSATSSIESSGSVQTVTATGNDQSQAPTQTGSTSTPIVSPTSTIVNNGAGSLSIESFLGLASLALSIIFL